MSSLRPALLGELLGTFLLVLFGTGSVACAVLTGALQGLWQVAVVWGFGVTLAIYCSASLSGAHLNPAVSLAFALLRPNRFPMGRLLPYALAQLAGAVAAALSVLAITKLPFSVPNDPVFSARSEGFDDAFSEYAVPQAILRFKQGFGRLIRSKEDRGIVVVLDRRLLSKRYGQTFLDSLPECSVVKKPLAVMDGFCKPRGLH